MIAAQIIDPGIFTKSEQMYVDICATPGPRYGDSMFWPKNWQDVPEAGRAPVSASDRRVFVDPRQFYLGPPPSAGLVNVLQEMDRRPIQKALCRFNDQADRQKLSFLRRHSPRTSRRKLAGTTPRAEGASRHLFPTAGSRTFI